MSSDSSPNNFMRMESTSSQTRKRHNKQKSGKAIKEMDGKTSLIVSLLSLLSRVWLSLGSTLRNPSHSNIIDNNGESEEASGGAPTERKEGKDQKEEVESNRKYFGNNIHNRNHNNHHHLVTKGSSEIHQHHHHSTNNNNTNNMNQSMSPTSFQSGGVVVSKAKNKRRKDSKGTMNSSDLLSNSSGVGRSSTWDRVEEKCDCLLDHCSTTEAKHGLSSSSCCCCSLVTNKRRQMGQGHLIPLPPAATDLRKRSKVKVFLASSFIFLLAVGIYLNSLNGEFVHDDIVSIVRNPDVKVYPTIHSSAVPPTPPPLPTPSSTPTTVMGAGADYENQSDRAGPGPNNRSSVDSLSGWWSLWKNDYWGMPMSSPLSHKSYRPLTVLTFRLNYLMGDGLSPLIFHGTNVLIHGLVSLLSLYLCHSVLKMRLASSLIASAMFALHPIHSEAIAGITGRSDALACLLMLISFLLYHKSLTVSHQDCLEEECHNQYDDGNGKRKEQSGGKDRSSKDDGGDDDNVVRRACRVSNVRGGDQELSCDYDTGNSNSSQGTKRERKKSSLQHYHHHLDHGEKDGGGMKEKPLSHNCSGDESKSMSRCSGVGGDEHHLVVGCSSDSSASCDNSSGGVVCDHGGGGGCNQNTRKKMRYFCVFCPWFIASGLVGCSAMLAKETGITILGINLVYDLYTHLHLLRLKRVRWQLSKVDTQCHSRLRQRVTLLIMLVAISLGFRIAIMNGTFPRFSRQDNPAAYCKSDLTRFLTYAFLPVYNFWLIICPYRLSYDWQMGSIPLIESPWDLRNLATALFYLAFSLLLHRAFILKVRGLSLKSQKQLTELEQQQQQQQGRRAGGGKNEPDFPTCSYSSRPYYYSPFTHKEDSDRESSLSISGTIVFVALLFLSVPFLPASNLLFPVGFVVAERILYTPSLGVCILTVHGMECFLLLIKAIKRAITLSSTHHNSHHQPQQQNQRHHKSESAFELSSQNSSVSVSSSSSSKAKSHDRHNNSDFLHIRKLSLLLVCLILVTYGLRTWNRNAVWQSRLALFRSGIKDNPLNAKMHYNYANMQKDMENPKEAIKHYTTAIRLWPEYASAHNNLGTLLDDPIVAENEFLRAIRGNHAHGGAHFNLGVLYMRNEKYKEALEHLEECLNIDPSHVEALHYLGACYNILNKTHEAENVFHKLISSDLPPSKLHTNFGVFLQQLGLNSEALTHFLLALTKTSWDMQALVHAAKLAFHLGSEKLFHELAERLLSFKFDQGIAHMLAQSYKEKGRLLEATHLFERLASGSDSFYKIHFAQMLIDVRGWTEAERTLREISSSRDDPYHSYSVLLLGQLYERMNKTGEAFEILNCAVDYFCPRETNLCAQLYSQLGNLMHTTGAMLSAANYYDLSIKFNPVSVQAHTNIGAIYHLMNDYNQANFHYKEALKIEPDNMIVLNNMKKLQRSLMVPSSNSDLFNN
ncbi:unnamed protein product [Orchesella dallaii]|uniref:dolichyl-phosphate-mannose--protein mannosyltransferase n=1 Tax=Orchesella dallaii TaxID=48710 RepID=A0ABP1QIV2_9HEXA